MDNDGEILALKLALATVISTAGLEKPLRTLDLHVSVMPSLEQEGLSASERQTIMETLDSARRHLDDICSLAAGVSVQVRHDYRPFMK